MSFNVYGVKPKTERGDYFGNGGLRWHILMDFVAYSTNLELKWWYDRRRRTRSK